MTDYKENISSIAAEGAVLGSLLLDRSAVPQVMEILPDAFCFSKTEHQLLYAFLLELDSRDIPDKWDLVVIREALQVSGKLKAIGGVEYLITLAESVPNSATVEYYARIVYQRSKSRQLHDYALGLANRIKQPHDIAEICADAEKDLRDIIDETQPKKSLSIISEALEGMDFVSPDNFISTGYPSLDEKIYGLGEGHMTIIAGRPGMGKTTFAINLIDNLCEAGKRVALFSLEMTDKDIYRCLISKKSHIPSGAMIKGYAIYQKDQIEQWKKYLKKYKLYIDETKPLTPQALRSRAYMLKKRYGVDVVFVDYLQLMGSDRRREKRYEEVTEISNQIKQLAMSLKIPVVVLSQLNRGIESRTVKRPMLSDLRESGSLEQDADVVLFVHRPGKYIENGDETLAEIIVEKQRRGATGAVNFVFQGAISNFEESVAQEVQ